MALPVDQMKHRLHQLDTIREVLAGTEPLSTYGFTVGDGVSFVLEPGWNAGIEAKFGADRVAAHIQIGRSGPTYQLSKDAVLEATSICGLTKTYAARCPSVLLEPQLNYWFREGQHGRTRDYQLLVTGDLGAALTRASIQPFSNVRLLEEAIDGIEAKYGKGEVLVDYKFTHTLRRTHLRLIVPEHRRVITGTATEDDTWSVGLQLRNSLTGEDRTSIDGYLFRWVCANGATDTRNTSGVWSRRGGGGEAEVYQWARTAVDEVLGGLESTLDAVQAMVQIPIEGQANDVLRDVFEHYHVPLPERRAIIEGMVEAGGQLTMYSVMQAVTQIANDPDMDPAHVDNLLRMGGDLPHAANSRCDACRRLLPH